MLFRRKHEVRKDQTRHARVLWVSPVSNARETCARIDGIECGLEGREVSSGGFYYFYSRHPTTTSARAGYPRSLSFGSISTASRRLSCLCRAPSDRIPFYTRPENSNRPHPHDRFLRLGCRIDLRLTGFS